MALTRYVKTGLTGNGSQDLNGIDGDDLLAGDEAHVYDTGCALHYVLDTSGLTANSPYKIAPATNPGAKIWVLQQTGGTPVADTDIDTGAVVVDSFPDTDGDACFWEFVVKKGANLRAGLMIAVWEATGNTVEYDQSNVTDDIGDTSDLVLSVSISSDNVRLVATADSDDWSVSTLRRII